MTVSLAVRGAPVSRETLERLDIYQELLKKWSPKINLLSKGSLADLWDRHIVDSAQLYDHAPEEFRHWLDLGSGGGLPGVVIAIIAAERNPKAKITMVESDQRKSTFLRTAVRETGVEASVRTQRIEDRPGLDADVISARALASLMDLIDLSRPHLADGGVCLFPKGRSYADEVSDAQARCQFELDVIPSITDADARILKLERIRRD